MADKARELGAAAGGILEGAHERAASAVAISRGSRVGDRVKLATYVSAELAEAIQELADRDERSVSWVLGRAIAEYVVAHR